MIAEVIRKHYADLLDSPIPALGGDTPAPSRRIHGATRTHREAHGRGRGTPSSMPRYAKLAIAGLLALSCGERSSSVADTRATSEDREPPPPDRSSDAPSIADIVEDVRHPALAAVEEELARTLAVARLPDTRRPASIAWTAPTCPSTYHVDARVQMHLVEPSNDATKLAGMTDGVAVDGVATVEDRAGKGAVVRYGEVATGLMGGGVKRPASVQPAGTLAETRLQLAGAQWVEIDGPTSLWGAFGSFPGVAVFFPALPGAATSTPWTLTVHESSDAAAVEAARGSMSLPEGFAPPAPDPHDYAATVELEGWLDVAGEPVAVLSAKWADVVESELEGMKLHADVAFEGRYAVLASGRLLYAHVEGTTDAEMSGLGLTEPMKQRHELVATARSTASCAGPVLVPPAAAFEPEAALLRRHVELRTAIVGGDSDAIIAPLAPEILRAHGRDALVDLLRDHVRRLGPFALGTPELASDTQRNGDRVTARMTGSAGTHGTVHTIVEGEVRDGVVVITRIATGLHRKDETSVLEISATRLHSTDPR